eukprot:jgi/Bigna1/60911/fgenesh1_kg.16_\
MAEHYEVLHLQYNATKSDVRKAYLTLSRLLHPDKFPASRNSKTVRKWLNNRYRRIVIAYEAVNEFMSSNGGHNLEDYLSCQNMEAERMARSLRRHSITESLVDNDEEDDDDDDDEDAELPDLYFIHPHVHVRDLIPETPKLRLKHRRGIWINPRPKTQQLSNAVTRPVLRSSRDASIVATSTSSSDMDNEILELRAELERARRPQGHEDNDTDASWQNYYSGIKARLRGGMNNINILKMRRTRELTY